MTFDELITKHGDIKTFKRYDYDDENWTQDQINEIKAFSNELSQAINNKLLLTGIKLNNAGKFTSNPLAEIKIDHDEVYYFTDRIAEIILDSIGSGWGVYISRNKWKALMVDANLAIKEVGGEVVPDDFYTMLNLSEEITSTLEFENELILLIQNKFKVKELFYENLVEPNSLGQLNDRVAREVPYTSGQMGTYTKYFTGKHLQIKLNEIKNNFDYALENWLEVSVLAMLYTKKPLRTETLAHSVWSYETDRMDYKELPADAAERADVVQLIKDGYQPMIDNKLMDSVDVTDNPENNQTLFKIVDMEAELIEEDLKFNI
mgnify:CR=1 FL=1|jgi:hypothetical protein|tara:strand:- start:882 stop:1838 length:957 start_codon:yes stop_codon:yes gene_type:complete